MYRTNILRIHSWNTLRAITPCICLSVSPSWEQWFALSLSLPQKPEKNCWFFSLFNLLLVVRTEWWLRRSLHVEQEIGSSQYSLNKCYSICCMLNAFFQLLGSRNGCFESFFQFTVAFLGKAILNFWKSQSSSECSTLFLLVN